MAYSVTESSQNGGPITMMFRGKTELSTDETPDSLTLTLVHQAGVIEMVLAPVITAIVVWMLWRSGSQVTKLMGILAAAACVVAMIANWRQGDSVSLSVTADDLVTQGNMGKLFETEQRIPTEDVLGMSYRLGGEGELPGLYVKLRWQERCILPRTSEEQAQDAIDLIRRKFPKVETSDSAFSIIGSAEVITLGLLGTAADQQGRRGSLPDEKS